MCEVRSGAVTAMWRRRHRRAIREWDMTGVHVHRTPSTPLALFVGKIVRHQRAKTVNAGKGIGEDRSGKGWDIRDHTER